MIHTCFDIQTRISNKYSFLVSFIHGNLFMREKGNIHVRSGDNGLHDGNEITRSVSSFLESPI